MFHYTLDPAFMTEVSLLKDRSVTIQTPRRPVRRGMYVVIIVHVLYTVKFHYLPIYTVRDL